MGTLGAYGKLPWAREFVRAGRRLGEAVEALIDGGAPFWMREGEPRGGDRIVLRAGETATALTVFRSSDLGGERRHPFVLGSCLTATADTVTAACAAWRDHDSAKRDIDVASDLAAVEAALTRSLPVPSPARVAAAAAIAPWAAAAFAGGREAFVLGLWHLRCLAADAGGGRPVRMPLSPAHAIAEQLAIWDALGERAFGAPAAAVLLPRGAAWLVAFPTTPQPAEVCGLLHPERSPVLDLSLEQEPALVSGFSAFARRCEAQLAGDDRLMRIVALLHGA